MVSGEDLGLDKSSQKMAIDADVGGQFQTPLSQLRERILQWTLAKIGVSSIVEAKEAFFQDTGMIFHDDEHYHRRMSYFLDTYLFSKAQINQTEQDSQTPFAFYKKQHLDCPIQSFSFSLFKILKFQAQGLVIQDLLSLEKIKILKQPDELFEGMVKNDIFQGFIFLFNGQYVLSHGLIFHPKGSHRILLKSCKELRKNPGLERASILNKWAKLQLKHIRLSHVDPKLVYEENRPTRRFSFFAALKAREN